jgi:hypothetical protein
MSPSPALIAKWPTQLAQRWLQVDSSRVTNIRPNEFHPKIGACSVKVLHFILKSLKC